MIVAAPRISPRLHAEIERLARKPWPIAEISRRVGERATELGLTRPSYQQVRVLVHAARRRQARPTFATVAVDVCFRARPPGAILDHLSGVGVPTLRP